MEFEDSDSDLCDECRHTSQMEDEWAGFLCDRDRSWLLKIQIKNIEELQAKTGDYYYMKLIQKSSGKENIENVNMSSNQDNNDFIKTARDEQFVEQFHNSLGLGSVPLLNAVTPRKRADFITFVKPNNVQPNKIFLLDLENMYTLLLEIEESCNEMEKTELVMEILPILQASSYPAMLCLRKGKNFLLRLLPFILDLKCTAVVHSLWMTFYEFFNRVTFKDQTDQLLPLFEPYFLAWSQAATISQLNSLLQVLVEPTNAVKGKKNFTSLLKSKFGVSSLAFILISGLKLSEQCCDSDRKDWVESLTLLLPLIAEHVFQHKEQVETGTMLMTSEELAKVFMVCPHSHMKYYSAIKSILSCQVSNLK